MSYINNLREKVAWLVSANSLLVDENNIAKNETATAITLDFKNKLIHGQENEFNLWSVIGMWSSKDQIVFTQQWWKIILVNLTGTPKVTKDDFSVELEDWVQYVVGRDWVNNNMWKERIYNTKNWELKIWFSELVSRKHLNVIIKDWKLYVTDISLNGSQFTDPISQLSSMNSEWKFNF